MPISKENKSLYPKDWKEISRRIRFDRADNKCEFCGAINYEPHPITKSKVILTVAHLNHNPQDCSEGNLKALCQKCHLNYDKKFHIVNMKATLTKKKLERDKLQGVLGLYDK